MLFRVPFKSLQETGYAMSESTLYKYLRGRLLTGATDGAWKMDGGWRARENRKPKRHGVMPNRTRVKSRPRGSARHLEKKKSKGALQKS